MIVKLFDRRVEDFIESFDDHVCARIARTIAILERCGHTIRMPSSKKIDARLFELRTMGNPAIRIFYTFYRGEALLLHGYIKQSQSIPDKELLHAKKNLSAIDQI